MIKNFKPGGHIVSGDQLSPMLSDARQLTRAGASSPSRVFLLGKGSPSKSRLGKLTAGQRAGRLVLVNKIEKQDSDGSYLWAARCDCGSICFRTSRHIATAIRRGDLSSCGCTQYNKGGVSCRSEYQVWKGIKYRCLNRKSKDHARYVDLGMHKEWAESFSAFISHVGPRPSSAHQIDRIDNSVGYFPGNVRWATWKEQARNRGNSYYWVAEGTVYETAQDVADAYGVSLSNAYAWFAGRNKHRKEKSTPPKPGFVRIKKYLN